MTFPTKRAEWSSVNDRVISAGGMLGTVIRMMRRVDVRDARSVTSLVLDVCALALQTGAHECHGVMSGVYVEPTCGTISVGDVTGHSPVTIHVRVSERHYPPVS